MPLSLTLWQHLYSLNALLVVQEMADTFGLLCLLALFLSAQLLARNYMFSIFIISPRPSSDELSSPSQSSNNVKPLLVYSSTLSHLNNLLKINLALLKAQLRGR